MVQMTLKAWRVNAGLSQKEAAKLIEVSNRTLWKWENGICYPKPPAIEKMCALYGCTYDAINFMAR